MKTLSWTSVKGKAMEAHIEYVATYIPERHLDGGYGGIDRESWFEETTITYFMGGEILGKGGGLPKEVCDLPIHKQFRDAGCTITQEIHIPGVGYRQFATGGITVEDFKAAVQELRITAPEEVKRMWAEEAAAKVRRERSKAERILACQNVFPDENSARAWRRRWNDINNEGGDGFVPDTVTESQQEWARGILGSKA